MKPRISKFKVKKLLIYIFDDRDIIQFEPVAGGTIAN
jgi:hypothetical protein